MSILGRFAIGFLRLVFVEFSWTSLVLGSPLAPPPNKWHLKRHTNLFHHLAFHPLHSAIFFHFIFYFILHSLNQREKTCYIRLQSQYKMPAQRLDHFQLLSLNLLVLFAKEGGSVLCVVFGLMKKLRLFWVLKKWQFSTDFSHLSRDRRKTVTYTLCTD